MFNSIVFHSRSKIIIVLAVIVVISVASILHFMGGYDKNYDNIPNLRPQPSVSYTEELSFLHLSLCTFHYHSASPKHNDKVKQRVLSDVSGYEYLDSFTRPLLYECVAVKKLLQKQEIQQPEKCQKKFSFINRTSPIVALVSFPGSGNTWVRHLIEQATGMYTGSLYCDPSLKEFFPGEYVVSSNVIVVKTHCPDSFDLPTNVQENFGKKSFEKAILIVRNPYNALISEANRQWGNKQNMDHHLGLAKESDFIGDVVRWEKFVEYRGFSWYMMLKTWLKESHMPVLVIQYEKLVLNVTEQVIKMTNFLQVPVTSEELRCVSANNQGHFKRKQHVNFDPFNEELKRITNENIEKGNTILTEYGIHYETR